MLATETPPSDMNYDKDPVAGLRHFVAAWRETLLSNSGEHPSSKQCLTAKWKRLLQPELPQETKDTFTALLDAMDHYITTEVAPRYDTERDTRANLDAYWRDRCDMYNPCSHILPATKNGLSVARSYMDMVLDHLRIGSGTTAYAAVEDASNTFHKHIYGRDKEGRRTR